MRKLLTTLFATLLSICAIAQNNITWEANGGMNIASFNLYNMTTSRIGFHLGVRGKMELPSITNGVYVNAAALFTLKGSSLDLGEALSGKVNAYALEIPIHIGYQHAINEKFSVFGEFGPYFSFGLFGKTNTSSWGWSDASNKYDGTDWSWEDWDWNDWGPVEGKEKEKYDTYDAYNRFDFGFGLRLGAEYKQKYVFALGYDFGLIDLWKTIEFDEDDMGLDATPSVHSRNFYITLGYKF